ncbi:hypothetical protein CCP3SC15_2100003 [Gammaproteobacteria bacterium]
MQNPVAKLYAILTCKTSHWVIQIGNASFQKQMVQPLDAGRGLTDATLWDAAAEVMAGRVDADLGGYLFKKRLARQGQGKSGGYRTIVGYKKSNSDRIVFLYTFAKNAKDNISSKEEAALSISAERFLLATESQVTAMIESGMIWEVKHNERDS